MTVTANKTGKNLKTYENTGTNALPTWSELDRLVNESLDFEKDVQKNKNRASKWTRGVPGHLGLSGSFTYQEILNEADSAFDNLWDSYLNDTVIEMAFMDGDIATTGNKGFRAGMMVNKMTRKRELEGVTEWDVSFELGEFIEAGALIDPSRYTAA